MAAVGVIVQCSVAVGVVAWPHFVLQVLSLCGYSRHHCAVLCRGQGYCMAAFCVAGTVIASL
jgi:hypothetical protein